MPRKNRRDPQYFQAPAAPPPPRSAAPPWAELPGFELRHLTSEKGYRCPGCDHVVRPGVWHLVVVPDSDPGAYAALLREARRRWGVGVVLNTSFNIHGEPLVCSPAEAIDVFPRSGAEVPAAAPIRRLTQAG